MKKRIVCILVSLCMVLTMFPLTAFAENNVPIENAAARIGDVNYLYLNHALEAVENGDTITVLKNLDKPVVIGENESVDFTLDLNGHSILVNNSVDAVAVYDGNVVIKNGTIGNIYKSASGNDEYNTALYVVSNVILYNVAMYTTGVYSSACYIEDGATLIMDDSRSSVSGVGADCVIVSYEGTAVITDSELYGNESSATTEFYKGQYGVVAYGEVSLENVDITRIEDGIYIESSHLVSIDSCNVSKTDVAISAFDSTDVVIDGGEYHAYTDAFYGENSNVIVGESTWSVDKDSIDAFRGEECVTLKSNISPSSNNWGDDYWVKFYSSLAKPSVAKTASYGAKAVRVRWNDVPGAAKYEIYRSTKASSGYTRIKTVADIAGKETYTFTNTGRTNKKTYYYKVKAIGYNTKVTSTSGYKKVKVNIAAPKLNITSDSHWIEYKFNSVPGANGYQLYYKIGKNGKWRLEDTVGNTGDNWYGYGYAFGKTYYFKIRAYDKVDGKKYYSSYSNVVKYYHKPPAVENLKVVNSSGKAKLTWSNELFISGYQIYRSTSKNGTYTKISTLKGASKKTYTDKKVKKGKTYYYKVRAYAKLNGKTIPGKFSTKVGITF